MLQKCLSNCHVSQQNWIIFFKKVSLIYIKVTQKYLAPSPYFYDVIHKWRHACRERGSVLLWHHVQRWHPFLLEEWRGVGGMRKIPYLGDVIYECSLTINNSSLIILTAPIFSPKFKNLFLFCFLLSSLHFAAQKGYTALVEFLIKKHNATIDSLTMVRHPWYMFSSFFMFKHFDTLTFQFAHQIMFF